MGGLKLYGMRTACDEIITAALKRHDEPQRPIGDLLIAGISEKKARSINYQMTVAKLPPAKKLEKFDFEAAEVNETQIRELATRDFLDHKCNHVFVAGTGTIKSHLAVSISRECIRQGRDFNAIDLVYKLETEARTEQQGRIAEPTSY